MSDRYILSPNWQFVSDRVMGGVSGGSLTRDGDATRLTGRVSLDNNGGFLQMAFDLNDGAGFDASGWDGIALEARGNSERYDVRLRTDQLTRPWESFRSEITVGPDWAEFHLPFSEFTPHRTQVGLDPARLRRVGLLAIGREFEADIDVRRVWLFRR